MSGTVQTDQIVQNRRFTFVRDIWRWFHVVDDDSSFSRYDRRIIQIDLSTDDRRVIIIAARVRFRFPTVRFGVRISRVLDRKPTKTGNSPPYARRFIVRSIRAVCVSYSLYIAYRYFVESASSFPACMGGNRRRRFIENRRPACFGLFVAYVI